MHYSVLTAVVLISTTIVVVAEPSYLQLTALLSNNDGQARFECWQMEPPFSTYPTVGEAIPGLAQVDNISYVVLPPRSNEGFHNPPFPMFFVLLSGLAHVTLPGSDDELWIMEGVNGLMIAADIIGKGHITDYPSGKPSVALQIPFRDGKLPDHSVIHQGVCFSSGTLQEGPRSSDDQTVFSLPDHFEIATKEV